MKTDAAPSCVYSLKILTGRVHIPIEAKKMVQLSLVYHAGIVLIVAWIASAFRFNSPVFYLIAFLYLYQVDRRYVTKVQRRIRYEERKLANQKKVLSDSETVRWLNHSIEKIWPICMERIASQDILMPIIPWFLEKYKPWTAKKAIIQHLYLGRNPPMFTEIRALNQSADDDHLVLDLGLNFLSANDMSAVLAVQMRKRLGFGMWANMHVTGMHVEGKVRVGVRFLREWPFLQRLRVCFEEAPYFQMTVKPIFSHGLDVTELPGIAGWLDKILAAAFEQSLIEPNMLVIDVEKLVGSCQSSQSIPESPGHWFYVDEKPPIAHVRIEIIEAADMKPSDPNGLADPFVKGCLGTYQFKTKVQKKTLNPKWHEEFKIPISSWESSNELILNVRDKDHFVDDQLGDCIIHVGELRGGQRHDKWIPLKNIKMGKLHVAITVLDVNTACKMQDEAQIIDDQPSKERQDVDEKTNASPDSKLNGNPLVAEEVEIINLQGNNGSPIWIHHPGSDVSKDWELRKSNLGCSDRVVSSEEGDDPVDSPISTQSKGYINKPDESSSEEVEEGKDTSKGLRRRKLKENLHHLRTVFKKDRGNEENNEDSNPGEGKIPPGKVGAVGDKRIGVTMIIEDIPENLIGNLSGKSHHPGNFDSQKTEMDSPSKGNVKDLAKNILRQATRSAHSLTQVLSKTNSGKEKHGNTSGHSSFKEACGRDDKSNEKCLGDDGFAEGNPECQEVSKTPKSPSVQNNPSLEKEDNTCA